MEIDYSALITNLIKTIFSIISAIVGWILRNPFHALAGFVATYIYSQIAETFSFSGALIAFAIGVGGLSLIKRPNFRHQLGKRRNRKQLGEGQATAHWSDELDLKNLGLFGEEGLLLGKFDCQAKKSIFSRFQSPDNNAPLLLKFNQDEESCEGNLLTVAPPGAGKGAGIVIPNLLTYPGSVVVTDPKGENFVVTRQARRRMGHTVLRLDPFNVCDDYCQGKHQAKLNPLDLLASHSDDLVDDARVLADTLILRTDPKNEFFDTNAVILLHGLIMYVACEAPPELGHLGYVRQLLTETPEQFELTLNIMQLSSEAHGLIARAATKYKGLGPKLGADVLSTAISNTEFLDSPRVVKSLEKSSFDLRDLKKEGNISLYLILPIDKISAYSRLLRLWVATTISIMARVPGKPRYRVLFLLDEMAQLGSMDSLRDAVAIIRGYGGTIWTILQDLSQIKALYPDNKWQPFVSSSTVQQYFGVSDLETAKYVSELLGQKIVEVESTNKGQSSSSGLDGGGSTSTGTTTAEQLRPLLRPEEIMQMKPTDQIIYIRGKAPIWGQKIQYYRDNYFAGTYDANPQHRSVK